MKYYSEKLNKLFDKEEDLKAAEKVVAEQEAAKLEAAKNKKAEAKVVEDAFKARNAARREYNEKVISLRKEYHDVVVAAKTKFEEGIAEAAKAKDESENAYSEALKEFTDKHPEGYHMTLKDGDNVITLSRARDKDFEDFNKEYNDFLSSLLNIWKNN
jgi:hypothetical protein